MSKGGRGSSVAFWIAASVAVLAVTSLVLAITTPPRSGPFCRSDCVGYPYTDAARFVPRDYVWMYPATLLLVVFVVLAGLLLEQYATPERRWLARVGLCFTCLAVAPLILAYGIQLTVMQPNLLSGHTDGLSLWSQYNPSGLFIALENLGYATLGPAFILIGLALPRKVSWILRATSRVFTLGGALILALLLLLSAVYRADLTYRFEVWSILIAWLVMAITAVLLSVAARRQVDEHSTG